MFKILYGSTNDAEGLQSVDVRDGLPFDCAQDKQQGMRSGSGLFMAGLPFLRQGEKPRPFHRDPLKTRRWLACRAYGAGLGWGPSSGGRFNEDGDFLGGPDLQQFDFKYAVAHCCIHAIRVNLRWHVQDPENLCGASFGVNGLPFFLVR
jgi:hypothetical protein